jgi:hypothetical protein
LTNFPTGLDDDSTILRIDGNITEIGADTINALRSVAFAVESEIGIGASGTAGSIAVRLNKSLDAAGNIQPSAVISLLNYLPITDAQVSPTAAIQESKLNLTYSTVSLYKRYTNIKSAIDVLNGFLSLTGIKLEPHIDGIDYHHLLSAIDVDSTTSFVKISPSLNVISAGTSVANRNTTNSDTLIKDLSDDLVIHEKSDGYGVITALAGGTVPPENYAHMAAGIFIDSTVFSTIPESNNDLQKFAEYVDNSSLLLLGSRIQNFYANGISNTSRSSSLLSDGYGEPLIPPTPVTAYFLGVPPGPQSSTPIDSSTGDDVILFNPTSSQLSTYTFDAQFTQVRSGDLLTINYNTGISYQFIIDSVEAIVVGTTRSYAVRINGKNIVSNSNAIARIDRSTFHRNKFGVLATAQSPNSIDAYESLIIANPRSAVALGIGFNPSEIDSSHYNLYLTLVYNGDPTKQFPLPAIDITGNQGTTPGQYTLDSIIKATNAAFRVPGFNYRFIAFQYNGQFGVMLADPYNNTAFSIVSGTVDNSGNYTNTSTSSYPLNVVDNFNLIDPLGFGISAANVASPPVAIAYASISAAIVSPTLLFYPLKRNFFYTDGVERERLNSDPVTLDHNQDKFGDGYWPATITNVNILPNRVETTYQVNYDLSLSGIKTGKTIVIQPSIPITNPVDNFNYGRFVIKTISLYNCDSSNAYASITVYDSVHGAGTSPAITLPVSSLVNLYFSDDSVSFDKENIFDGGTDTGSHKRFFEVYVDGNGHSFTHERARFLISGADISNINLYNVSPKLRGYPTNSDKEIRLLINDYSLTTGVFDGYLGRSSGSQITNLGPTTTGKKGEIVRFYDETNIDYIDFTFGINDNVPTWTASPKTIDIQLFPSLLLDDEIMPVATCQVNDIDKSLDYLRDARAFGNVSEVQFTNSAVNFISSTAKYLHQNAVIRGLDFVSQTGDSLSFRGGLVLVNGQFIAVNAFSTEVPVVKEIYASVIYTQITWAICINKLGSIQLIPLTDFNVSLDNPNAPSRLVSLFNPAASTSYSVDCSTFSNLVNNRQDLTIIYTVVSKVV